MSLDFSVGSQVVEKRFPAITRHRLALYCGASGDHNPIHVDLDFAKAAGFPDVFAHGMLAMAWLGQAVTDVLAPENLRAYSVRFAAITQLGAELTCTGTVAEIIEKDGERLARLDLKAVDQHGEAKLVGEALVAIQGRKDGQA